MRSYIKTQLILLIVVFTSVMRPLLARGEDVQIIPSLDVKQEYNDNLYLYETERYITTVSPILEFIRKSERYSASILGRADILFYSPDDAQNQTDQLYKGHLDGAMTSRMRASIDAGYTRDSRIDRDIETTGLIFFSTDIRKKQNYSGSTEIFFTETTGSFLSLTYGAEEYEIAEYNDSQTYLAQFGLFNKFSMFNKPTTGHMNWDITYYDYTNSNTDSYSWNIGVDHKINEKLDFSFNLGFRYHRTDLTYKTMDFTDIIPLEATIETEEEGWGGVGKLALTFQGEITNSHFTLSRDLQGASGRSEPVYRTELTFGITHRFLERIYGSLNSGYYINESDPGEFSARGIDEKTFRIQPSLRFNTTDKVSFQLSYTYRNTKDDIKDVDWNQNRVFLNIHIRYPLLK